MRKLANIFWLGTKELRSFAHDYVLLGSSSTPFRWRSSAQAQSSSQEVHNAAIAIVDEDHSQLSRRIARAFLPPYFKPPQPIAGATSTADGYGAVHLRHRHPAHFERDVSAGASPRSSSMSMRPR